MVWFSRRSRLVAASLAVAAGFLACGSRTELDVGEPVDATIDHPADHASDHHDATLDAPVLDAALDAEADAVSDAPSVYDGPVAPCGTCSADFNANETFNPNWYQGAIWLAYEFPVGCDQFAAWIAIHADTSVMRVYADDGTGRPGAEIVPPTPAQPMGDAGWFEIPANVQLVGGRSYFVSTSLVPYYPKTNTRCPFSIAGSATRWYGSYDGGPPWAGPFWDPPMIRAGNCP